MSSWSLVRLKSARITANNKGGYTTAYLPVARSSKRTIHISQVPSELTSANPFWHRVITHSHGFVYVRPPGHTSGWVSIEVEDGDTATVISRRLNAVSRLWPLGQEPHILALYSTKRTDKDDGIHNVGGRSRRTEEVAWDRVCKGLAGTFKYMVEKINAASP
ncbi:hypothetical protein ARMSODRAFT_983485 [Armillaria solidipes]|uniref:Uncharacterized protein n=1 Tax=Armillaria solidipes TaxID=1076256 RepID=A0A2H3AIV6_9AGAR|nr:hypothetical protein ARMSODRAFT_983485 [Armillaria solidipes]